MDDQRKGFLRTALTEERVGALEKQMALVIEALERANIEVEAKHDQADVHVSGVRPPDGSDLDDGRVEQPTAVVREVRRKADEPRVQAASDRRKRSR